MRKPKVYDVYSYGKHIFTGTRQQISKETGLAISTLANIVSHGHKQYRLEPVGKLEPVYALYERDMYVASGTVQELADMVGMSAKHLNWRQFDSVKNMGIDYRYHIYKLEGEYEVVRDLAIKWRENLYEVKRRGEIYTGTSEQISKEMNVKREYAPSAGKFIGTRYAQLKVVDLETSETFYGNLEDVQDFTGMTSAHIKKMVKNTHHTSPNWEVTFTGQYIVDLIGVDKPKSVKPVSEHISVKPVYSNKPVPMSRYAQELFEWSTKHLRREA